VAVVGEPAVPGGEPGVGESHEGRDEEEDQEKVALQRPSIDA
jgi:hypothetical protein